MRNYRLDSSRPQSSQMLDFAPCACCATVGCPCICFCASCDEAGASQWSDRCSLVSARTLRPWWFGSSCWSAGVRYPGVAAEDQRGATHCS